MTPEPRFSLPCCAWAALRLLQERKHSYPARVEAGQLNAAEAEDKIATSRAIVMQWRWALDPALPPFPTSERDEAPFGAPQVSMMRQLRETAAWERQRASAAPINEVLQERAELAAALVYYQDAPAGAHPMIVRLGLAMRRSPCQRYVPEADVDGWIYQALGLPLAAERRAA